MSETTVASDQILHDIEEAATSPDRDRAIDLAISAMGQGIDPPVVLRLVAEGLEQDGRPRDAARLLERATLADPQDIGGWIRYGRVLLDVDHPVESLAANRNALAIEPNSYEAHLGAGKACLKLQEDLANSIAFMFEQQVRNAGYLEVVPAS